MGLLSWIQNKLEKAPKLGVDYNYIDGKPFVHFKLLKGKFKGVVYHYGHLSVLDEELDDGSKMLKFDLVIVDPGKFTIQELNDNRAFVNHVGKILTEIIISQAEREKNDRSSGDYDTEELGI